MELLADILVKENLLVPEKEFLDRLDGGDGAKAASHDLGRVHSYHRQDGWVEDVGREVVGKD